MTSASPENRPAWRESLGLRAFAALLAMALVVAVPFLLRPKENLLAAADDTLVIVTPNNEAIRYEFARAFAAHHKAKTGRTVRIDWRMPGGTSEIARFLKSEFTAAFQQEWLADGKLWTPEIAGAFDKFPLALPGDPATDTPAQSARRAFLASGKGIGIDLFFGGGSFDFEQQANAGRLIPSRVLQEHPDWFSEDSIPQTVSGEPFRDAEERWFGTCLSAFGICYNTDSLRRLRVEELPATWSDLRNPAFFNQVALADPTKSGSAAKAFEMLIQQQMQELVGASGSDDESIRAIGWSRGLEIIMAISANARYFTESAGMVSSDVAQGEAAIGMSIDFLARFQSEAVAPRQGPSRLQYITPIGGSSVGVDPIAILRGAPHRDLAEEFLAFTLSPEGQKLWNFRVGTPGGPSRYALRRLPVRKELYRPEFAGLRSDPDVQPYEESKNFVYHPAWTGPLFKSIGFVVRVMCLDAHEEQSSAWRALVGAKFPRQALKTFCDVRAVGYDVAMNRIRPVLSANDRIGEVRLARELGEHFRAQYREAERLAREGK